MELDSSEIMSRGARRSPKSMGMLMNDSESIGEGWRTVPEPQNMNLKSILVFGENRLRIVLSGPLQRARQLAAGCRLRPVRGAAC